MQKQGPERRWSATVPPASPCGASWTTLKPKVRGAWNWAQQGVVQAINGVQLNLPDAQALRVSLCQALGTRFTRVKGALHWPPKWKLPGAAATPAALKLPGPLPRGLGVLRGILNSGVCAVTMLTLAMMLPSHIAIDQAKGVQRALTPKAAVEFSGVPKTPLKYISQSTLSSSLSQQVFGRDDIEEKSALGPRKRGRHPAVDVGRKGKNNKNVKIRFSLPDDPENIRGRVLSVGPTTNAGAYCPYVAIRAYEQHYLLYAGHSKEAHVSPGDFLSREGDTEGDFVTIGDRGRCDGPNAHFHTKRVRDPKLKRVIDQVLDAPAGTPLPKWMTHQAVKDQFFAGDTGSSVNLIGLLARWYRRADRTDGALANAQGRAKVQ